MTPLPSPKHVSVLPDEVIRLLDPQPGETWVDCTTGVGGHTRAIAEQVGATGRVFGFDQDAAMLAFAEPRLAGLPVTLLHANFEQVAEVLTHHGVTKVDGIFADLGFCSDQMSDPLRGFSFQGDGPLDMRLNPSIGQTAADLVNTLSERALADVFWEYGEERKSRWVAKRIVERRTQKPFETTAELAELVRRTVPRSGNIDQATRVFQALRIAVNDELGALERLLASFHSLEDRRVKTALFRTPEVWHPVTKKPVEAGDDETARNPRARSAKLRVAKRISG